MAVNPVTNKIYDANNGSGNVTVIDGAVESMYTVITTSVTGVSDQAVDVNPVTNKIYIAKNSPDASVALLDGVTNMVTANIPLGVYAQGLSVVVNPVTNKIYVGIASSNTTAVIDGITNTIVTTVVGSVAAVNPVTNRIYLNNVITNAYSNFNTYNFTVMDGATNTTVAVLPGIYGQVVVNPVTNKIYVVDSVTDGNVIAIDGATYNTTTVVVGGARAAAVNPLTNKIYVSNATSNNVTVIDGATNATTNVNVGTSSNCVALNPLTNKIYVCTGVNVTVIDGATNATAEVGVGTQPSISMVVDPVSNKTYALSYSGAYGSLTAIDGPTNTATSLTGASFPSLMALNPITGKIYATYSYGDLTPARVTVITEANTQTVSPATSVTPLANNQSTTPVPGFAFTASSKGTTTPDALFYQFDTWQSAWTATSGSNPTFTGSAAPLLPGFHILYAYATDGQEGTATQIGSPLVGSIQAYGFLVTPPSAGTGFVTGQTPGPARNNYSGFVGMELTVGSTPISVSSLGRYVLAGNSQSHLVKLVQANGADVPGGSVSVATAGANAGTYQYAALASPVTLVAGTSYFLVSQETAGGDQWYDFGPVTTSSAATVVAPVYTDGVGHYVPVAGLPGKSYVPVSFSSAPSTVSTPTPLSVAITSPTPNATISGITTIQVSTTGVATSLQVQVDGVNYGVPVVVSGSQGPSYTLSINAVPYAGLHQLTVVANGTVISAQIPVNFANNPSLRYPFVQSQTPGPLRNNYTGFVGMSFGSWECHSMLGPPH